MPTPEPPPSTWTLTSGCSLVVLLGPGLGDVDHRVGAFVADDVLAAGLCPVRTFTASAREGQRDAQRRDNLRIVFERHSRFSGKGQRVHTEMLAAELEANADD